MRKRIICFCSVITLALMSFAQNSINDINLIKRDKAYLYGEATLDQRDAALKLAYELLEMEIKNWAIQKSPKVSSVLVSKIFEYADTIILPRRNMFRAFVFVKTSNLKVIKGKTMTIEVCQPKIEVKEEPKTEIKKEVIPEVKENIVPEVKEEPKPEVTEEPKPEAKPEPVFQKTLADEVLERLMKVEKFTELEAVIKPLKAEGKITDYGKYTAMPDPAGSYLIIYDKQASIKAFLGKGTTTRRNLQSGIDDSEKNYHGCGAIWFKIKE